jgi:hypothetical protein
MTAGEEEKTIGADGRVVSQKCKAAFSLSKIQGVIDLARTAVRNGVNALYHYGKFHPEHLTTTLRDRKLYFSDVSSLNDPWDCRPWFDHEHMNDGAIESFIELFFSVHPSGPVSPEQVSATKHAIRTRPEYRRAVLERFSQDFLKMIPSRWRIYCLTPIPESTLMWSHYGDNHRGICLEFGTETRLFGSAIKVAYCKDYPKWSAHVLAADPTQVLLTKSDDWAYEHEYRILGLGDSVSRPAEFNMLTLTGGFMSLPDRALKSVIVGCEADFDQIAAIIKTESPGLPIKRAVRSPSQYRLVIEDHS